MGVVEEHIKLTNRIATGELTKSLVLKEIERIEREYGGDAFGSYCVKKKDAPWTKADVEDLEVQSASGACSKDFYIYMAEVSEFVHKGKNASGILGVFQKIGQFIVKHWLVALTIVGIILGVSILALTLIK